MIRMLFLAVCIAGAVIMTTVHPLVGGAMLFVSLVAFLVYLSSQIDELHETLAKLREWPQCPCKPQIQEIREAVEKLASPPPTAEDDESADPAA